MFIDKINGIIMKQILGLILSPRKSGNSEILIKEISKHIPEEHELSLLRFSDFNLKPCTGCYRCLFKENGCRTDDDFKPILKKIVEADAIILAVPTYFYSANSLLKVFLDRCLSAYDYIDSLWKKPSIGIGLCGIEGLDGHTLLDIQSFMKLLFFDIKATTIIHAKLTGDISFKEDFVLKSKKLGESLYGNSDQSDTPTCPLCGGSFFQFLSHQKVKCALCSNEGQMLVKENKTVFKTKDKHRIFFSKEEALHHKEWLKEQRSEFLKVRKELREINKNYRNIGEWIKPQNR